ncbi:MAG: diaminopimelate decarboxylase [Candidatus Woesearchaeota archaeon]|jgi:diaminopimelate decarboxylase|nr:diaminopimelate decarboxylase [Candidatus Woesearchaeota archaeon]MDP7457756.1 diaminopimelate decarboxylase [Candidatus Woesearchaeota archaeon]
MTKKTLPFNLAKIKKIIESNKTPFHIYDEKAIRDNAKQLYKAFSWIPNFKNHFAVKACPNPFILKILKEEGMGTDCSSLPELLLSEKAGIKGEDIMFTSNDTPAEEFVKAKQLGAVINLDDISHIEYLEKALNGNLPDLICFRYNPGPLKGGNAIIGEPEEAKYGFTKKQLLEGYKLLKEKGVKRFGLHTMVASNELNPDYHIDTARMLFELVVEIKKKLDINIEFINLGGGYGIPYKLDDKAIDLNQVSQGIKKAYEETIEANNLPEVRIVMESGRMITGPFGFLVTKVRHLKHTYKDYVGTDACMANLMRPALYGAYHHITVLGKETKPSNNTYDVTGSLCENNDKFAIDRKLPKIDTNDILVIHDTGAHGHAMGFNYNGKLRSSELLLRPNGEVIEIRRAETVEDYFSTLDFNKLKNI